MSEVKEMVHNGADKGKQPSLVCYLIALPVVLLILLLKGSQFIGAIIIPFTNYSVFKGLLGSPWVGLENFKGLFSSFAFEHIVFNTLAMKIEYVVACSLLALVLALALSMIRVKGLRKFFAALFAIPYFIPVAVFGYFVMQVLDNQAFLFFINKESLLSPGEFRPAYIALEVIKKVGIPTLIALAAINANKGSANNKGDFMQARLIPALKAIGLFALIELSALLTVDTELLLTFYNPRVFEVADTLDTYAYRSGLVQAKMSIYGAVWLLKLVVQLPITIGVYFLIKNLFAKDVFQNMSFKSNPERENPDAANAVSGVVGTIISCIYVLILIVPLISTAFGAAPPNPVVSQGNENVLAKLPIAGSYLTYIFITLAAVLINAFTTAILAYPLTVRDLPGRSVYAVILILILSISSAGIHEYLFFKSLGMVNTVFPYFIGGIFSIVNVFVLKAIFNGRNLSLEERSVNGREGDGAYFIKRYLPGILKPLLALSALQFVAMWNSYYPSQLWYISNNAYFSPVMMFRAAAMSGNQGLGLLGLIVSVPSILIGILLIAFAGYEVFASQVRKQV